MRSWPPRHILGHSLWPQLLNHFCFISVYIESVVQWVFIYLFIAWCLSRWRRCTLIPWVVEESFSFLSQSWLSLRESKPIQRLQSQPSLWTLTSNSRREWSYCAKCTFTPSETLVTFKVFLQYWQWLVTHPNQLHWSPRGFSQIKETLKAGRIGEDKKQMSFNLPYKINLIIPFWDLLLLLE